MKDNFEDQKRTVKLSLFKYPRANQNRLVHNEIFLVRLLLVTYHQVKLSKWMPGCASLITLAPFIPFSPVHRSGYTKERVIWIILE